MQFTSWKRTAHAWVVLTIAMLMSAVGCATQRATSDTVGLEATAEQPTLTVRNNYGTDVRISVVVNNKPTHLGNVASLDRRSFALPANATAQPCKIRIQPLGSRTAFDLPGATFAHHPNSELEVGVDIKQSALTLR